MKRYLFAVLALIGFVGNMVAQKDVTSEYITNAAFTNGTTGWTVKNFSSPVSGPNTGAFAVEAYAGWSSLGVTSYSLTQKIILPKGSYRLANNAFFRQGDTHNTNASKSLAYLKAGSKQVAVKTLGSITASTYANTQAEGADCLGQGLYPNVVEFDVASDNTTIEIGITGTFDQMRSWCITGGFELTDLNAKDDRKGLLAALERFENDYNLADGTDYSRVTMSAEAWTSLISLVKTASLALDDNTRAEEYSDLRDALNAKLDATDASISLFNDYQAIVSHVLSYIGTLATPPVYTSDTNTDATLRTAIDRLTAYAANFKGGYLAYLTAARGFTEVKSMEEILGGDDYCYILTSAESAAYFVGIGRYEVKPDWAGDDTKALRYRLAGDPVVDLSNFFTIEKENGYIGLRNVVHYSSLFQTHDNAGFMYVLTYTEPVMSDWCYLKPTYQSSTSDGFWLFESGKYPVSSGNWACGYLGPWNNRVEADEPIALNRRNTTGDEAGHYRLWRISRADLLAQQQAIGSAAGGSSADMTYKIINPSFETGDETGWTLNGREDGNDEFKVRGDYTMTNKAGNYLMNAHQWWAPSLSVSQTIDNLPSGEYSLSAVVATWEGRTVTLSANDATVTQTGRGDQTGIRISTPVAIGPDGKMTVKCESTAQWWEEGHEDETRTFFKLDDVQLRCTTLYLDAVAVRLPNNETRLVPGQWYYYESDNSMEYVLIGNLADMVYTTNGAVPASNPQPSARPKDACYQRDARTLNLPEGRTYFMTTASDATLVIMPYNNVDEGSFTAVALNVDGLPNTIATIELNPDGPGSEGTKKISQYLASKQYDVIGCSEDFNYHGSLISALMDNYSWGTVRKTLSVSDLPVWQTLQGNFRFDTDGLNLIWKNTLSATNESWTQWNSMAETDGNQYVKKGFRHYDLWLSANAVIDVYVLHMDAGDTNATWSRHEQWQQLANAINDSDHSRAKLIIGDTNSRWTREEIASHFTNVLSTDLVMSDVWVELYRNGIYPTTDMGDLYDTSDPTDYSKYEVVDKIIYINPTAANTVQLKPQSFCIEQDYTYDYVDHNGNMQPLGDHKPVVVNFKYHLIGSAKGDVNGDGTVDVSDVVAIISAMGGTASEAVKARADVNSDGTVNAADIETVISIMAALGK